MGIGISYTGYDGRTRHAQANSAAELPAIMGEAAIGPRTAMTRVAKTSDSPFAQFQAKREELDPVDGPLIGNDGENSMNPDGMQRIVGSRGGWRVPVSRTEESQEWDSEHQTWKIRLAKFTYDLIISEKGLVKGRSVERKDWEAEFVAMSAKVKSGGGKFGVKAVFNNDDELTDLYFGPENELSSGDPSQQTHVKRVGVSVAKLMPQEN